MASAIGSPVSSGAATSILILAVNRCCIPNLDSARPCPAAGLLRHLPHQRQGFGEISRIAAAPGLGKKLLPLIFGDPASLIERK